jgi:flagellar biosynthetic protein FliP
VLVIDGGDRRARILGRGTNRVQGRKRVFFIMVILISAVFLLTCLPGPAEAQPISIPSLTLEVDSADNPEELTQSLQILLLITLLSLAPALLIMVTCFTRIIVVFSFLRNALATQPMPPNQVLIGLALFLTFFIMAPTWQEINQNALQPYIRGEITQDSAFERGMEPLRDFMFKQTRENDLALFVSFADIPQPETYDDIPNHVLIPAFIISELKTAFQIGFVLFIPFLVIDMVIASTLMSMGMLMLPPMMISLPFKILLFIMVDGWSLLVRSLILSYS